MPMKAHWPAPERNKLPIADVLKRVLPAHGTLLEIASGSGQHAAYFVSALPGLTIQPTDVDPDNLASIAAYQAEAQSARLLPPRRLDVLDDDWGLGPVEAIFCANMIHIAPWACCEGLLRGAARQLAPAGVLVLYGPYRVAGAHTAASNEEFDRSLRTRDPRWGVRDLEAVSALAEAGGLHFEERVAMPANNQCLVYRKRVA